MTDDHDRCEWVNVSSGTGSPGLSRTKSESRKMVVAVVKRIFSHRNLIKGPNTAQMEDKLLLHCFAVVTSNCQ